MVKKMVINSSGDDHDVDDVFQESIVMLYRNIQLGKFLGKSSIKTYFYAISRNLWYRKLTKSKNSVSLDVERIGEDLHPSEEIQMNQDDANKKNIVAKMLDELTRGCRNILRDFYFEKLSLESICEKYGFASKGVAKTKKHRCLKKLIDKYSSSQLQSQLL